MGSSMKVTIFGAGYVGLSFAACLAEAGHEVLCADADPARIEGLQGGRMPLHEPGLEALVASGEVKVDGQVELRKTCKIRAGQVVLLGDTRIAVHEPD